MTEPNATNGVEQRRAADQWRDHQREHSLATEEHRREHDSLAREVASAAAQLASQVRDTAAAFDTRIRDATSTLEARVKEVAQLHWDNHRVEHLADQRALDKVERNMDERFKSVNEFREQQKDIIAGFLPRKEYDGAHTALEDRVDQLRLLAGTHITREEFNLIVNQFNVVRDEFAKFREREAGKKEGSSPYTGIIMTVVTAVLVMLALGGATAVIVATRTP